MLDMLWYSLVFALVYLVGLAALLVCLGFMASAFIFHLHRPQ